MRKSMIPTPTATPAATPTIKKTYKYYNDNLELVSKEVEVVFVPASDATDAMNRLGNNEALILKALNAQLQRLAISDGRKSAVAGGINRKILLGILKPFRLLPPYNKMVDETLTGAAKSEAKRKQNSALLEMLKGNPVILEAIKAASQNADDDEDDDTEDDAAE